MILMIDLTNMSKRNWYTMFRRYELRRMNELYQLQYILIHHVVILEDFKVDRKYLQNIRCR